jgi:hypothetical protein
VEVNAQCRLIFEHSHPSQRPAAGDVGREHCYDPATGLLRPNHFSDVAQHWVLQAVPAGLALVRDAEG